MFQKSSKNNLKWLSVYQVLHFFGINSFWLIFLSQKGMTLFQIGLLESVFHLTSLLSEVPSGLLADRFSYKTNLYLSQVFAIVSSVLMLMGQGQFWVYALGMAVSAWSYNFDSGTSSAMLFESAKEAHCEDRYLSLTSLMSGLLEASRALGKIAAGFLVHGLIDWIYYIKIALAGLIILVISFMAEPKQKQHRDNNPTLKNLLNSVQQVFHHNPRLLPWLLISQVIMTIISMVYIYYQSQFSHLTSWQISLVMLMATVSNILAVWLASHIGKHQSAKTIFLRLILIAALLFWLPLINTSIVLPLIFLLSDALLAFFFPIFNRDLQVQVPSEVRATMLSVSAMIGSLAMIIIFPMTGFLMDWLGFTHAVITLGAILTLSSLILCYYNQKL